MIPHTHNHGGLHGNSACLRPGLLKVQFQQAAEHHPLLSQSFVCEGSDSATASAQNLLFAQAVFCPNGTGHAVCPAETAPLSLAQGLPILWCSSPPSTCQHPAIRSCSGRFFRHSRASGERLHICAHLSQYFKFVQPAVSLRGETAPKDRHVGKHSSLSWQQCSECTAISGLCRNDGVAACAPGLKVGMVHKRRQKRL